MSRDPDVGRSPHERANFMKIMKIMKIIIFEPDLKLNPRGALRFRAMYKVTRRALSFSGAPTE